MKLKIAIISACFAVTAGGAQAQGPTLIGCYKKVKVPAQYEVSKTLIKEPVRKYIKRNGRYELVEYAAIYQEDRKLIKEEYFVMKEVVCN